MKVRWWYILLPTLLQLSTLILFITTVVYSHHNSILIWKPSILAIIYHGVEGLDGKKYLAAERLSGMNTIARVDKVQFSRSADGIHHLYGRPHGWRIVEGLGRTGGWRMLFLMIPSISGRLWLLTCGLPSFLS